MLEQINFYQRVYTKDQNFASTFGTSFVLPLYYETSDGDTNLSGLTLNIHYNSALLTPSAVNNQHSEAITKATYLKDTNNLDADLNTDSILQLLWVSFDSSFPGITLPALLANISWTSVAPTPSSAGTSTPSQSQLSSAVSMIRFTASDVADGYTFLQDYTVVELSTIPTVLNQAPTALNLSSTSINEGTSVGSVVANLTSTDADAGDTFTYALVSGSGDTDNSAFLIEGNQLKSKVAFDYEAKSSYSIRVRSTDAGGLSIEKVVVLNVVNVNEAPTALNLSSTSISENSAVGSVVANLTSTDTDAGDTFTYALVSGSGDTDNSAFLVEGNQLKSKVAFDYEAKSSYSIRVRSTDAGGLIVERVVVLNIVNVNEAPTALNLSSTSVSENTAVGSILANLTSTDADAGDTFTYTLVSGTGDTHNSAFLIEGNQLKSKVAFDFETKSSYSIRIKSTDTGGLSVEKVVVLNVVNVNEAATALNLTSTSISENIAVGAVVANLTSTDADAGDTFTYALVNGTGDTDNSAFLLDGNQLKSKVAFDYETKSSYSIRVRSTDAGGLSVERVVVLNIVNVNEAPTALNLSSTSINEGTSVGSVVANLTSTDADAGDTFTYALVSGSGDTDNSAFLIEGNQLKSKVAFDYEARSSYSIRVRSTDAGGLSVEKVVVLNVVDTPNLTIPKTTSGTALGIPDTRNPVVVVTSSGSPDFISISAPVNATLNALTTESHGIGAIARNIGTLTSPGTGQLIPLKGLGQYSFVATAIPEATTTINLEANKNTAFFLHDAYSAFYEGLTLTPDSSGRRSTQRVLNVDTIKMGSAGGTSIVDLTSKDYVTGAVTVYGANQGRSIFWGTSSNDAFISGGGDSVIFGGGGVNQLTLGTGKDTIQYRSGANAIDKVSGFVVGQDKVELWSGKDQVSIEPNFALVNGSTVMTWGGNQIEFVGVADLNLSNLLPITRTA